MKKGFFLLLTAVFSVFLLYGCHSNEPVSKHGGAMKSGYPVGHEMNSGTNRESHPARDGFS
jgi:hypothetical protein